MAKKEKKDILTLEFDDGELQICIIEGVFDCDGQDYIALVPDDGSADVYIYKYFELDDNNYTLEDEEDPEKFEKAVIEFEQLMGHKRIPENNKRKGKKKGKKK